MRISHFLVAEAENSPWLQGAVMSGYEIPKNSDKGFSLEKISKLHYDYVIFCLHNTLIT